jgi:hypothetical protein
MRRVSSGLVTLAAVALLPVSTAFTAFATATSPPTTVGAPGTTAPPDGAAPAIGPIEIGLDDVVVVGPTATSAGDRPMFSWEPVDGAVRYTLAVLTATNEPLWAWDGTATDVILGGWPGPPPPEAPGPVLTGPAAWFVVAYDAAGTPIAVSDVRAVSPT